MSKFFPLKVSQINRETQDAVSITLDAQDLNGEFSFKSGQYITIKLNLDGEEFRRSYSLCSAPFESKLKVAVKEVQDGKVSTFLNRQLTEGSTLECMSPEGSFTPVLNSDNRKHYMLFAAGSGITPVISIVKSILKEEKNSVVTLIFGNRSEQDIIFKSEIESLDASNPSFNVHHVFSSGSDLGSLHSGRIDFGKTIELRSKYRREGMVEEFFVCGPSGMMDSVINALDDLGIDSARIHKEYFVAPGTESPKEDGQKAQIKESDGSEDFDGNAMIKAELDGGSIEFSLHRDGICILDAALDEGADAPYSCKGGVCTTCKAKLIKGTVDMDANYALTPDEVEEGYILACQSHPTSKVVEITWDH